MIHLIYISSATSWPSEDDLKSLLEQSRARNLRQNITGLLLYDNAMYMQVLEGAAKDVHEIYAAIKQDSRSAGVVTLIEEDIQKRDFPDWSMGFKNLKSCSAEELPGYMDVFNGKLSKELVTTNKSIAVKLLLNFSK